MQRLHLSQDEDLKNTRFQGTEWRTDQNQTPVMMQRELLQATVITRLP